MQIIPAALIAILLVLAALHLYWGVGGYWPGHDPASLAARVVGTIGRAPPNFYACAAVTLALCAAAYIIAAHHGAPRFGVPHLLWTLGYWGAFSVFLLRGIAAYVPRVFAYARGTEFFTLNQLYYAPLCLIIAAGMAAAQL